MINIPSEFYNEETKLDYRITPEMKKVWAKSLLMADKLVEVCEKNNLKCWIDAGTLLGAVRHKGFIPWDDDIDFVMFRKDYDKLVKIADKEFQYPYLFQTTYSDVEFYCGHARIRDDSTSAFSKDEINRKYCRGIGVDIFVLDGFIENGALRFFHRTYTMILKKLIRGYLNRPYLTKDSKKKWISYLGGFLLNEKSYKKLFEKYESAFRSVDCYKSKRVSDISFIYSNHRDVRHVSSYDETVWMPFEMTKFPAPKNYDDVLTSNFGKDYMTPLHLSTVHGQIYLNADLPYTEACEHLKKNPELFEKQLKLIYT